MVIFWLLSAVWAEVVWFKLIFGRWVEGKLDWGDDDPLDPDVSGVEAAGAGGVCRYFDVTKFSHISIKPRIRRTAINKFEFFFTLLPHHARYKGPIPEIPTDDNEIIA